MNGFEKQLADELHERLDGVHSAMELPPTVARRARRGRRLTAAAGMMTLVMLIGGGGWFGAAALDRGTDVAAPGQCLYRPDHDLTIYLGDWATKQMVDELGTLLSGSEEVEEVTYVSKKRAFAEFKERYKDQPEFYEDLPRDALPARFDVELQDGVDPSEFAAVASGAIEEVRFYGGPAGILCPEE